MNLESENLDEAPSGRNWTAMVGVALAALIFCFMIGVIFYRNLSYDPPALLVVEGTDFYVNAVVTIEAAEQLPVSKTLLAADEFQAQFPVKPGLYSIRVERDNCVYVLMRTRVLEHQRHIVRLQPPPATAPAALPRRGG